jgi:hypothetical protein
MAGVIGYQPLDVQGAIAYGKASVPDFYRAGFA